MGLYQQTTCIFTGLPAQPYINTRDAIEYIVNINSKKHFISLSSYALSWPSDEPFFIENKNLFFALLYNNDWFEDENTYITIDKLKELIAQKSFPKNPEDKIENLFINLTTLQKEDGEWISVDSSFYDDVMWKLLYFKSVDELNYYVKTLDNLGLINANYGETKDRPKLLEEYQITYDGLIHSLKLRTEGENSNKCFVAMAFKPETIGIRSAIKEALEKTGFEPIIIDEQNIDSDKTINDEIIANLRRSKFCIADFSYNSLGVYFESGFALGQGKKVIYTCQKDEFAKVHFDIKPLQHIIYESTEKLKEDLINKIEAWIK